MAKIGDGIRATRPAWVRAVERPPETQGLVSASGEFSRAPRRESLGAPARRMRSVVGGVSILSLVVVAAALAAAPALPPGLDALIPADRGAEVAPIVADPTFVRRLEFQVRADVGVYTFLLDHPDLNAALARPLGIARYEVVQVGPGKYRGHDGAGNTGTVDVFSAGGPARAFLERGVSPGWWFGDIGGRVVALVAFSAEGGSVRGTVTVWARIDRGVVDLLLRLLKPVVGRFLDRKLREQFTVAAGVAEAAAQHPDRVCPLLGTGAGELAEERQALARLAGCP